MLNFCDFIQVYVFTRNHHLNSFIDCGKYPGGRYQAHLSLLFFGSFFSFVEFSKRKFNGISVNTF